MPLLAKTFEAIADDPHALYNGSLVDDVVADIQEAGKIGCPLLRKFSIGRSYIKKNINLMYSLNFEL